MRLPVFLIVVSNGPADPIRHQSRFFQVLRRSVALNHVQVLTKLPTVCLYQLSSCRTSSVVLPCSKAKLPPKFPLRAVAQVLARGSPDLARDWRQWWKQVHLGWKQVHICAIQIFRDCQNRHMHVLCMWSYSSCHGVIIRNIASYENPSPPPSPLPPLPPPPPPW